MNQMPVSPGVQDPKITGISTEAPAAVPAAPISNTLEMPTAQPAPLEVPTQTPVEQAIATPAVEKAPTPAPLAQSEAPAPVAPAAPMPVVGQAAPAPAQGTANAQNTEQIRVHAAHNAVFKGNADNVPDAFRLADVMERLTTDNGS